MKNQIFNISQFNPNSVSISIGEDRAFVVTAWLYNDVEKVEIYRGRNDPVHHKDTRKSLGSDWEQFAKEMVLRRLNSKYES